MKQPHTPHIFLGEDIIVNIPILEQAPVVVPLIVEDVPVDMQPPPGFIPQRVIANLVFANRDNLWEYLTNLPYPVEVMVRCHIYDFDAARGTPVLAFWDGTTWIPFGSKHEYVAPLKPEDYATITITSWIDPPMAWGT
jgi:hypothetical protein